VFCLDVIWMKNTSAATSTLPNVLECVTSNRAQAMYNKLVNFNTVPPSYVTDEETFF
jgi:hypothetical protein